jgi:TonB family protein
MRTHTLALALILSLVSLGAVSCGGKGNSGSIANSRDAEGYTLNSSEGGFTVTLPPGFGQPEQNGKKYQAFNGATRSAVLVQYLDLPEAKSDTDQEVFDLARSVAMERQRTTIEKEEDMTVQGHPARSVRASGMATDGSAKIYYRHEYIRRDGARLYELLFASPNREELDSAAAQAYFQSFRINEQSAQAKSGSPVDRTLPDIAPPPPVPTPNVSRSPISAGALDSRAASKPDPPYPPVARAIHASGKVVVQVTVDEQGRVKQARAVSGPPLLQQAATQAARQARFNPGPPMTGTLTYDFTAQ